MAKQIIYIDDKAFDELNKEGPLINSYHTQSYLFMPERLKKEFESDKIELVSSPRPVDRDHLKRDFKAALDDIETTLRYLRYMYGEL